MRMLIEIKLQSWQHWESICFVHMCSGLISQLSCYGQYALQDLYPHVLVPRCQPWVTPGQGRKVVV